MIPARVIPTPTPRKSGLSHLQRALLSKGIAQNFRPMSQAETERYIRRQGLKGGEPR